MHEVLLNFWSLIFIMGVGFALVRFKIMPVGADRGLAKLIFAATLPALMFDALRNADIGVVFSATALVGILTFIILFITYYLIATYILHLRDGMQTIGALAASYINAGNLGIAFLLATTKDAAASAPIILFQLGVVSPLMFLVLDRQTRKGNTQRTSVRHFFKSVIQPPVLGVLLGLLVNVIHLDTPSFIDLPVQMLAAVTVPLMMIAMGISLGTAKFPKFNRAGSPLYLAVFMRSVLSPLITLALAQIFSLEGGMLLTALVVGSFPTANNVFIYAHRYRTGVSLARDAGLITTLISMPLLLFLTAIF